MVRNPVGDILCSIFMQEHKEDKVIEELEQQGELPKDVQKGGAEYENEEPRQGL